MNRIPYLIIGNSAAAMGAVEGIRRNDPDRPITVVAREPHHTYSRPLISYLLAGEVDEEQMMYRPEDFYEKNNVTPLLGVTAEGVDSDRKIVGTDTGEELAYENLLVATGGSPILPPKVEGMDANGVFTFTTWEDANEIEEFIEAEGVENAVVVGGGLIGLKSMEALVNRDIHTTLVELADQVLNSTFDETASEMAQEAMEAAGVDVRCSTTVQSINQKNGKVDGATLRCGTDVPCSLVIFAIGVLPNTDLLEGTEAEVDRGIIVDDRMESSLDDVYAAGDVAQARELFSGEKRAIPILPNAYRQGLIAGMNMADGSREYEGGLAMNSVDVFGLPTISIGVTAPDDPENYEIMTDMDTEKPIYRKIVLRDNRIVGAIFIGDIDRAGIITGLARQQIDVTDFKDRLLTDDFGLIALPEDYREKVVSGQPLEV
jgi:NAD(P)H-nitrite reductase large subunit